MAKRQKGAARSASALISAERATEAITERRVVAFAEQMGRLVASVQTRAEGWLNRKVLSEQLLQLRAGATELLAHLGVPSSTRRHRTMKPKSRSPKGRSGGIVDAPGKKHRRPLPADPDAAVARSQAAKMRNAKPKEQTHRRHFG